MRYVVTRTDAFGRDLSDTDRVATRCLLQALQRPRPELARQPQSATPAEA
ncbi:MULTISPECIES: hypothetical protein [unclassified Pseudomonas]|nr:MULTISPECIES: hypothetical protein [unclassified Pseudomonas]MCS4249988.1 hypothetical protein [Pseudomonas sp. BIGb0164]NWE22323.1 hypothetical protein [Pseudomonas sp. P7548]